MRPTPLTQDALLGLFKGEAVGRGVVLEPATTGGHVRCHGHREGSRSKWSTRRVMSMDGSVAAAAHEPRKRARGCHRRPARRCWKPPAPPARARRSTASADYPAGPHDQPQSMCPAFGVAARRTADAAHRDDPVRLGLLRLRPDLHLAFLRRAAHRRLRAVQFRDAGQRASCSRTSATPCSRSRIPRTTTRSSSSIFACPRRPACRSICCRRTINGVRIIGIDVPGFGVPTHAEAKDVLAGAMLRYARQEAEQGPVRAPRGGRRTGRR